VQSVFALIKNFKNQFFSIRVFLLVDGEKVIKSIRNQTTLKDVKRGRFQCSGPPGGNVESEEADKKLASCQRVFLFLS